MAAIELEDPLHDSSLLSLLPKTLTATSHAQIAGSEAEDLESIEGFFKSTVVKGSMQLVQQAQTITKSYTNSHGLHPEDGSFAANCKNRQPERRPALGRKRAKFSLKPDPSHSLPSIDISSTIDHIDDPEEYFLAFEQLENAEKELKKLRGEVHTDQVQNHQGATARKRRPGLRGKTASYKHHTSANDETAETFVESQEKHLDLIDVRPCNLLYSDPVDEPDTSQAKNTNSEHQESTASEGHVAEKEKNVDILLEKVLSSFKDFDGDEGETYLRESLHIKPIDAVKIDLPPLPIQLSQHSTLNNRAARGQLNKSEISSPITRSPIEAISVMQRRILLKDPLKDLYSSFPVSDAPDSGGSSLSKSSGKESLFPVIVGNHDDGSSPVVENGTKLAFEDGVCSPDVEVNRSLGHKILSEEKLPKHPLLEEKRNPDHVGVLDEKGNNCDEFDCVQEGNDVLLDPVITDGPDAEVEVCNIQPRIPEILNNPSPLLGEMANCNFHADDKGEDILGGFHGSLQMEGDNLQKVLLVTNQPDTGVEVLTSTCVNETTTESLVNRFRKVGGSNGSSGANIEEGFSDDISQSEVNVTVQEKVSETETSKDNSCAPEVTTLTDRHLETLHSLPDQHNEEHQIASGPPPDEGSIQKAPPPPPDEGSIQKAPPPPPNEGSMRKAPPPRTRNKNKSTAARHSLAGGGTIWEAGRRKSSRRKFKPLEHWRGERLLYGRIHNSMATVIAVKYASPGKKSMKVESCVSEEYAELVAKVGRC